MKAWNDPEQSCTSANLNKNRGDNTKKIKVKNFCRRKWFRLKTRLPWLCQHHVNKDKMASARSLQIANASSALHDPLGFLCEWAREVEFRKYIQQKVRSFVSIARSLRTTMFSTIIPSWDSQLKENQISLGFRQGGLHKWSWWKRPGEFLGAIGWFLNVSVKRKFTDSWKQELNSTDSKPNFN